MLGGIVELDVLVPDVFDIGILAPGELLFKTQTPRHLDKLPGVAHGFPRGGYNLVVVLGAPFRVSEKPFPLDPQGRRQDHIGDGWRPFCR